MDTAPQHNSVSATNADSSAHGSAVRGYSCPSCGASDQIYRCVRPYRGLHLADAVLFGWIGWLNAESDRRSWLICKSCGHQFRPRSSLFVWWLAWCVVLALGAVVAFWTGTFREVPYAEVEAAGFVARCGAFIGEQPVAAGFALLWIIAFTGGSLLVLSCRVRRYRRKAASANQPGARD